MLQLDEYGELIPKYDVPPNATPPVETYWGEGLEPVALHPFPLLSFQVVTDAPERTIVLLSPPSNHNCNPGIDWGENPHTDFPDAAMDVAMAVLLI